MFPKGFSNYWKEAHFFTVFNLTGSTAVSKPGGKMCLLLKQNFWLTMKSSTNEITTRSLQVVQI